MAEAADPTRPFLIRQWCKVSTQMLLQIASFTKQQSLIEIPLNKTIREEIEGVAQLPARVNSNSGQSALSKKRVT